MNESRRFEVKALLGEGGFGCVYLADMVSAGGFRKEVALKVLRSEVTASSEAEVRLRDEARLLGLLRHRNIVAVDDLVRFPEGWGVVMEYVPGVDLGVFVTHLRREGQSIPPRAALDLVRAVAKALEIAYQHPKADGEPLRAIHRDIKPGNIRITPDGEVKVLDFGIARANFDEREAVTGDARFGSLAYMSPERVLGDPEGPAGDVYALGVVLWESLVGRQRGRAKLRPVDHDAQVEEMLADPAVPDGLKRLIHDMVAYEAQDRPSAAEVGARARTLGDGLASLDLESFAPGVIPDILDQRSTQPVPSGLAFQPITIGNTTPLTGPVDSGSMEGAPTLQDPGSSVYAASAKHRSRGALLATVLGFALVIGVGGFVASQWLGPSDRPPASQPAGAPSGAAAPVDQNAAPKSVSVGAGRQEPAPVVDVEPGVAPADAPVEPPPEPATGAEGGANAEPVSPDRPAPTPVPASKPAPASDSPPTTSAPPSAAADPSVEVLRGVKFSVEGASSMRADCGDATGSGAASALVRNVPVGRCSVEATVDGATLRGEVVVDSPRMYRCSAEGGLLQCQ